MLTKADNPLARSVYFQAAMVLLLYQIPSATWMLPGGGSKSVETSSPLLAGSVGAEVVVLASTKTARLRLKSCIMMADARFLQC